VAVVYPDLKKNKNKTVAKGPISNKRAQATTDHVNKQE
jgi:hypothetical protein